MNADERRLNELTERIIGCVFEVSNRLGCGFLEKPYENALKIELEFAGLTVLQQHPIPILYRGKAVGDYFADLLVEAQVTIELKVLRTFEEIHLAQCINYLKATALKICLLINFAKPKVEIRRIVNNL